MILLISLKDPLLDISPIKFNPQLPAINDEVYVWFQAVWYRNKSRSRSTRRKDGAQILFLIIADESAIGTSISSSPDKKF